MEVIIIKPGLAGKSSTNINLGIPHFRRYTVLYTSSEEKEIECDVNILGKFFLFFKRRDRKEKAH